MEAMFNLCEKLDNLNISSFNIDNVKYIDYIFHNCKQKIIDENKVKFNKFNYNDIIKAYINENN